MEQRVLRVLALCGFCVVFGAMVWILDLGDTQRTAYVAVVAESSSAASSGESSEPLTDSNKQCPRPNVNVRYEKGRPWNKTFSEYRSGTGFVPVFNLYGKECREVQEHVFVVGHCVAEDVCRGDRFLGPDGKLHDVPDPDENSNEGYQVAADTTGSLTDAGQLPPGYQSADSPYGTGITSDQIAGSNNNDVIVNANSGPVNGNNPVISDQSPAANQINTIANTGGDTAQSDSGNANSANRPAYRPSQALKQGDSFNLSSLFSGLGGGGSSGGSGVVAYGPTGPAVYNNRNFDAVSSQMNFPQPHVTAEDLIAEISRQNPPPQVAPGELQDKTFAERIVDTARQVGGALLKPVSDLLTTEPAPAQEAGVAEENVQEEATPKEVDLEEQEIELNVLDLLLVPGDPRFIIDPERLDLEELAKNANPFFDGALVRTRPWERAREIADAERADDALPQVSSGGGSTVLSVPSSEDLSTEMQDVMREALEASRPGNALTTMRETAKTVSAKVGDLLKSVASTLFWWL